MRNISKLNGLLPPDIFFELSQILNQRDVTKNQLVHLLATCEHECGWKNYIENLNYRPDRLLKIFPKRVVTIENAIRLCNGGPKAIGNFVYNGRMGNASNSDDGFNFRGRGCIQLTGRNNYTLFSATVMDDIVKFPEMCATKYKLAVAFWYFDANKIWLLCEKIDVASITNVRKKVNGGTIGLDDVQNLVTKYSKLID
jgi:putative chitinase